MKPSVSTPRCAAVQLALAVYKSYYQHVYCTHRRSPCSMYLNKINNYPTLPKDCIISLDVKLRPGYSPYTFNSIRKSISLLSSLLAYFAPGIEVITWMGKQSSHSLTAPSTIYTHHSVWPSKLFFSPHTALTAYSHQPFMSPMNNTARLHLISASKLLRKNSFH